MLGKRKRGGGNNHASKTQNKRKWQLEDDTNNQSDDDIDKLEAKILGGELSDSDLKNLMKKESDHINTNKDQNTGIKD